MRLQLFARAVFGVVNWLAARRGLAPEAAGEPDERRVTGMRGETYAYWYLRRHGYVMIARNFTSRGLKGEIDLVGYDGATVAFVEVKTRTGARRDFGTPEAAVTPEKRRHLSYIASQFLREYHAEHAPYRFDVLAIEASAGRRPVVRLHKGAFAA